MTSLYIIYSFHYHFIIIIVLRSIYIISPFIFRIAKIFSSLNSKPSCCPLWSIYFSLIKNSKNYLFCLYYLYLSYYYLYCNICLCCYSLLFNLSYCFIIFTLYYPFISSSIRLSFLYLYYHLLSYFYYPDSHIYYCYINSLVNCYLLLHFYYVVSLFYYYLHIYHYS